LRASSTNTSAAAPGLETRGYEPQAAQSGNGGR
jgi:hypothetical protein